MNPRICGLCFEAPSGGPHACWGNRCACVGRHIVPNEPRADVMVVDGIPRIGLTVEALLRPRR